MTWEMAGIAALTVAIAVGLSAALVVLLFPLLKRYILAKPNARSSHRTPTPQGGGIAVIAAALAAIAVALALRAFDSTFDPALAFIIAAAAVMAGVGAVDDVRSVPVAPRLLLQAMIITAVIYEVPGQLRVLPLLPRWLEQPLLVLGGLWFVNLVNFMDGIDLMTAAEVIPLTATLAALGIVHALPPYGAVVALALGGAMLGFAYFNRPVAKVFLGDVGSLPIGLLLGWLLLLLAGRGHLTAAVIMPLYYLADASVTLARRLMRGEPLWRAHRTHFYQLAIDRGFNVIDVVTAVLAVNVCLCALAALTVLLPGRASEAGALVGGGILVASLLYAFARGRK